MVLLFFLLCVYVYVCVCARFLSLLKYEQTSFFTDNLLSHGLLREIV